MRYSLKAIVALAITAFTVPVHAATVVTDSEGVAIGILNLEVEGFALPFNVNFEPGERQDIYGSELDYDFTSVEAAAAAVDAINAALNDSPDQPREVGDPDGVNNDTGFYGIGYETVFDGLATAWLGGFYSVRASGWISDLANNPFGGSATDTPIMWADFTVVPVPAAVWLFGSALGLLGWVRKRTAA